MPKKKGPKKKCAGRGCRRKVQGMTMCPRCRMRKLKAENPMEYAYRMQRSNAQRRGYAFTLTREQYRKLWEDAPDKWAAKVASLQAPGRTRRCLWEVDRIDPQRGYVPGNVRLLQKSVNIYRHYYGDDWEVNSRRIEPDAPGAEQAPF